MALLLAEGYISDETRGAFTYRMIPIHGEPEDTVRLIHRSHPQNACEAHNRPGHWEVIKPDPSSVGTHGTIAFCERCIAEF